MLSYLKFVKRVIIFIIGSTVVLIGIITLVTPGPAFIIIPSGLAILATEFVWARRWLQRVRQEIAEGGPTFRNWREHLKHIKQNAARRIQYWSGRK